MLSKTSLGFTLCGLVTLAASLSSQPIRPVASVQLPGARPTIDAATFASLQAALDALPERGGEILIPAGEFEIHEPLVVSRDDVLIRGAGTATHLHNANTEVVPAIVIRRTGENDVRPWRIQFADLRITGNAKSGHGILAERVNELFLDGVTVSYHGGDGMRLDHCYEDPRISNCLVTYNNGTGLNLIGCHDIVVCGNQFEENQDAVRCSDGFNLCMTGNCVDDHLGQGVIIENTYGSVISGNMIEECHGAAVILARDCYGISVSANVIAHNGAGIDLLDAHGCAVSANAFTIMKTHAVRIGPQSGRITVTGNNFSNSYIGDGQVRRGTDDLQAAGMTLDGSSSIAVSGNLFASVRPKAVEMGPQPPKNVLFDGNVIVDSASDHAPPNETSHGDELMVPGN